jgi:transglutaminase-like putative cysteine protease
MADEPYAITRIPAVLLKGANAVKRNEEIRFRINSLDETVLYKKYAITVLNEIGERFAPFLEYYDRLRSIRSVKGTLYDEQGRVVKKTKSKDISDRSAVDENNLVDDSRIKFHQFWHRQYPYTVEYEVEIRFNNSYIFPKWIPRDAENLSVEQSLFTVEAPSLYDLRYKTINYTGSPEVTEDRSKKVYVWKIQNLPAQRPAWSAPPLLESTPGVLLAPSLFKMEGFSGSAVTWKELGLFAAALNKGRDVLSPETIQKVKDLTAGMVNRREKVIALYQYLQQTTRYVSIQLGIGGLQPAPAALTAQKGYGDCKALSNYMHSLLKAAGIPSWYTWIKAGSGAENKSLAEDFPSDQFNHIVLCVPLVHDTMWLECTSQTVAAGYMGDFTGNRKALLITDEGGKLVTLPHYGLQENTQLRTLEGRIDEKGNLDVAVRTVYSGLQQDYLHGMINGLSDQKIREGLEEDLGLSIYKVNRFQYREKKDVVPHIDEELDLLVQDYALVTGKRLFIIPNLLNRAGVKLHVDEERDTHLYIYHAFRDVDSVVLHLPDGYEAEVLPPRVNLHNQFGRFESSVQLSGNKLVYVRVLEQYSGRFPPSVYAAAARFQQEIYRADRSQVVLVKKQAL